MKAVPDQILKMSKIISNEGIELILSYEISSVDYYNKKLKKPTVPAWQTTQSGVTIGIGWDCGYNTEENLYHEWVEYLDADALKELAQVLGLKSSTAYKNLNKVKGVVVEYDMASAQFENYTISRYYNLALRAYKELDEAPQAVKDVIVSLVFNRGNSLKIDFKNTRKEMILIKEDIQIKNYKDIAKQLKDMKRLWPNVKGLQLRRDAEAEYLLKRL